MTIKHYEQECDDCGQRPHSEDAYSFADRYLCPDCASKRIRQSDVAPALLAACEAALAYLCDPPSRFAENRQEAGRIICEAISKAGGRC